MTLKEFVRKSKYLKESEFGSKWQQLLSAREFNNRMIPSYAKFALVNKTKKIFMDSFPSWNPSKPSPLLKMSLDVLAGLLFKENDELIILNMLTDEEYAVANPGVPNEKKLSDVFIDLLLQPINSLFFHRLEEERQKGRPHKTFSIVKNSEILSFEDNANLGQKSKLGDLERENAISKWIKTPRDKKMISVQPIQEEDNVYFLNNFTGESIPVRIDTNKSYWQRMKDLEREKVKLGLENPLYYQHRFPKGR